MHLCMNRNRIWLEGVRGKPNLRQINGPASKKMVEYGREHPINESAAVLSVENNKL
jgi:hypothetical protein